MGNKFAAKVKFCLLPAAVGLLLFYLIPYGKVILYSVVKSQYQKRFVGLRNYREVLENPYFQLACWNTLLMILICVPLFVILSIVISVFCMQRGRTGKLLHRMSILPLLLPSAGAVAAFSILFGKIDNPFPVYGMFLWKYVGMGVVILTAAFSTVDPQIKEAARMDGAGMYVICRKIILPLCRKPLLFTVVLGIVYCFRTFRESFLYYNANYPPDYSYTLQYYMNNQFLKLKYQSMAAASVIVTVLLAGIVVLLERVLGEREALCGKK